MKWIEKLLDTLKLDDTNTKVSEFSQNTCQIPFARNNEKEFLRTIKKYWETSDYNSQLINYRHPTLSELKEYAKADVLSCFTKSRTNEKLSDFRLSQLEITNWHIFFNELLHDKYIRYANSKEILSSYLLKDLKIIADSLGVKKSGRKADLVQRIYESVSENELDDILSDEILFIIDEKGKDYLKINNDLAMLRPHASLGISLSEFIDNRFIQGRKRNFYDTMFQALSNQKRYYGNIKNYGMMSMVCLHIYDIMFEEYEHTEHNVPIDVLLLNYIEHLYLQTCLIYEAKSLSEGIMPYANNITYMSMPRIKTNLTKFSEYKKLLNFKAVFANKPPSFLTKGEFIKYIEEYFCSSMFDYSKWDDILRSRFSKYVNLLT